MKRPGRFYLQKTKRIFSVSTVPKIPPMSIGLGLMLVAIQGLRLWRGKQLYVDMARFWTRVFGLIFAIGVAQRYPDGVSVRD
jgi:cytochrome d ubiquinol oxidase subunit I